MTIAWRHRLLAIIAAILVPAAFLFTFAFRPPPPTADATTARHVATALQLATAPYAPIVILNVTRLADSATMAHAVEHQCVLGDHQVTLLSTVSWQGTVTANAWANRPETRKPGCHDVRLDLPLPPADGLVIPRLSIVEIPIRPDGQLGAPVTFGAR